MRRIVFHLFLFLASTVVLAGKPQANDLSRPALGKLWKDPQSGLLWSDIKKNPDGSAALVNFFHAQDFCSNQHAILPKAELFDALSKQNRLDDFALHWYWTSSEDEDPVMVAASNGARPPGRAISNARASDYGTVYDGETGDHMSGYRAKDRFAVRCVVNP